MKGISGLVLVLFAVLSSSTAGAAPDSTALQARAAAVVGSLPSEVPNPANPVTDAKVRLGRALYFDGRLSENGELSCNGCHPLDHFGADGEPTSLGTRGARGERNAPTVYNAALHIAQFWDGRSPDVEDQAKGPILNPGEMAMPSAQAVVSLLRGIPGYAPLFAEAFPGDPDPISYDNVGRAIGAFERRLLTPAPLDAFIAGDRKALNAAQQRGLETFLDTGCTSCHVGPAVGGGMYRKLGLVHPYETRDTGREKVTGNPADRGVFKVPSLRNVAETAPYFHDGSVKSLAEAVRLMAWHQLGRKLKDEQIQEIVTFLGALTGKIDPAWTTAPKLP